MNQNEAQYVIYKTGFRGCPGTSHIITNNQILGGEPIIKNTRTPVRAIVEVWRLGTHPENIPNHLPHLSLRQVFDALNYYNDHQEEIEKYIEENRIPNRLIDPLTHATQ